MNLAEEPHQNADSSVSWVHCRSAVFRISKPLLSKFITPSRGREGSGRAYDYAANRRAGPHVAGRVPRSYLINTRLGIGGVFW